jgi:hypothetical protein
MWKSTSLFPSTENAFAITLILQDFLFNIASAPAWFVVDGRNARMRRRRVESLQSRQMFIKIKLGTKSLEVVNVARIDFAMPPIERPNEFRKKP